MRRIDKYKTAEEAEEAFCKFCKLYYASIIFGKPVCFGCPYKEKDIPCRFKWAFDEEKEYE